MKIAVNLLAAFALIWAAALGLALAAHGSAVPHDHVSAAVGARFAPPLMASGALLGGRARLD